MERTLIILKPDAVKRGIVGEIVTRFERVGMKIVGTKMLRPDYDHYYHHYENIGKMVTRRGQKIFDVTLEMMNEGPVIAMVLEGICRNRVVLKLKIIDDPVRSYNPFGGTTKLMKNLKNILAWYGVSAILLAYMLLSFKVLSADSLLYQLLNLSGSIGIIVQAAAKKDTQPVVLNIIWSLVALAAIIRIIIS
jgi:nucleoside diphosphate kinase